MLSPSMLCRAVLFWRQACALGAAVCCCAACVVCVRQSGLRGRVCVCMCVCWKIVYTGNLTGVWGAWRVCFQGSLLPTCSACLLLFRLLY
jgi:hypothetical protein